LKTSYLAIGIVGILLLLAGIVFVLQGDGMIGGSAMTGVTFWIYAGSGVVVVGLILAFLGFYMGSKSETKKPMTSESQNQAAGVGVASSDSPTQNKEDRTTT
jgi:hypothetical protein